MEPLSPAELRDFVAQYIPSLNHLDALLLLSGNREQSWTTPSIAGALQIDERVCARVVGDLTTAGLTMVDEAGMVRYAPSSDGLRQSVEGLIAVNQHRPVTLIREVYGQSAAARSFSDAFRIRRKEEKDG